MTSVSGMQGTAVALVFDFGSVLDTSTGSISITNSAGVVVAGPTTDFTDVGLGVYSYVWIIPLITPIGQYVATMTGKISGVAVDEFTNVQVSASYVYESVANIKDELGITTTTHDDKILRAVTAASRAVENACGGRRFWRDGALSTRVAESAGRTIRLLRRPRYAELIMTNDIATATGMVLELGDDSTWTTVSSSLYTTWPDNALARSKCINGIVVNDTPVRAYPRIRLTAEWGWPAYPDAIVAATRIMAMRYFERRLSPEGVKSSAEWGIIRIPAVDPDVAGLISGYVLPAIG